jgi:surfactin synthase thioesterase subunit
VRLFAGGHFYINDDRHRETVVAEVRAALDALRVETAHAQPAIVPAERTA